MARNYSNVAEETSLTAGINNSATSITVGSNTGYPSVPYTIILDPGLATEEVCEVTAVAGTTWTVTRGVDGTPATSHDLGAVVVHGYSARDLRDIQDHISDATGVHGIGASSSVVGTTDTQTMTNKTLTNPTINGGSISGVSFGSGLTFNSPTLVTPTIASFINAQHTHTDAASGGTLGSSGSAGFTAYKRSGGGQVVDPVATGLEQAVALVFGTEVYKEGNATWTSAASNTRVVLPSDIANGVWHVTAGCSATVDFTDAIPILAIYHQDLGLVGQTAQGDGNGIGSVTRRLSVDAEFKSASAGRWVEVRYGDDKNANAASINGDMFVAVHRVA